MTLDAWKIIYTKYEGITKRTVQLLSKELGKLLIRELGVYRIHVLPCEREGAAVSKNALFVTLYENSDTVRSLVSPEEVPDGGYLVKVIENPNDAEGRYVILTAHDEQELFYAAVSFIDDYIPANAPHGGANLMPELILESTLPLCSYTEVPDHKSRCIFTWGHPINDYRAYIDNMARAKFNELILWNDYIPLNIDEVVDYAHSYGIRVILGYSWGWKEIGNKVTEITDESIERVKKIAIDEYRNNYQGVKCDGIYFQSFTERKEASVGGKLISAIVVDMVNDIAEELWKISPDLRLIFGLHATSVKEHLGEIARVHPRMEIMWEDCGTFPFNYASYVGRMEAYYETKEFVKEILKLRDGKGVGLLFKSIMMMDWSKVVRQLGPYIMGDNDRRIADHDRRVRAGSWREYSADWMKNGALALEMIKCVKENKLGEVDIGIAGTLDGGIYLPMALYGQMFRDSADSHLEILSKVARRGCITVD